MKNEKKSEKLGMSFGVARQRLDRDLLFKLAIEAGHVCHRCGNPLTRDSFSVDHVTSWMRAENPREAFFDLKNIAFSHFRCNSAYTSARIYNSPEERYQAQLKQSRERRKAAYCPKQRSERYSLTGY